MTATYMYGGCASLKEYTMHYQDQFTLSLLTACLMQQNQMLKPQDAMLHELMDRGITTPPVDQAGTRKRAAKKRRLARKQSAARKRSGK